ncbi:MAG TPA: ATP-binding protein, partial [Thermoanaerobaculia bacterium]|nr:ATP-binding protein [Thermoanaerobaculia bacterium]
ERRMGLPEYGHRSVRVRFERTDAEIRITIRDQGEGFDWKLYLQIDPSRAFDTHGRGIAMANLFSFHALEYRGCGNEVTGVIRDE